ncbi:anti-sigma regulatory factor (Ser/Thr protein kinase) [Nonomuraea polychroma]|uniref:Anti-sigma regulatory factor (Ser/Thr protein kinase) n=2 Tax=Nonomuraea polychroma TaxID=46176 RepID=A0A438MJ94_9ACTN|nr:anti-sigma regulatory factor (Ser/Thr protein kinase) [Nonomuraea polychroma]
MQMSLHPLSATPIRTAEYVLPSVPSGVGEARSLVRSKLTGWGLEDVIDDCLLIVSELITNAIRYGGAAYALRLEDREDRLYGEVFDPGDGEPRPCSMDVDALSGRGLQIVAAIADDWGVSAANGGKVVWFSVSCAP